MENGGLVEWKLELKSAQFHEGLSAAQQAAYDFYKALSDIDKATTDAEKSLDTVGHKGNEVAQIMGNLGYAVSNIATGALTAGITTLTASFTKMAKQGIADTSALEDIQIQMQGLTHSATKANAAMGMAVEYFRNNPFNRFEVTNATKSLIQFGAELEEVPNLLDKLGKVSLSTGAKIDEVAYYYQRNISDGRVATLDLLQMQNRGIPIFKALADQMGVTAGAVRELAGEGKIAVEDFQAAFDKLVDDDAMKAYEKTLSRQMDAYKGRLSNLRAAIAGYDATQQEGIVITQGGLYQSWVSMLKTFNDAMKTTSPIAIKINESLTKLGQTVGGLINKFSEKIPAILDKLGDALAWVADNSEILLPILAGAVVFIGRVASRLPIVGGFVDSIGRSLGGLAGDIGKLAKLNPALTVFIGLFSVGLVKAFKENENFRKSITKLVSSLASMVTKLMPAIEVLINFFVELASSSVVQGIIEGVAWALGEVASALASMPKEVFGAILGLIAGIKLLNVSPIYLAIAALGGLFSLLKEISQDNPIKAIIDSFKKFISQIASFAVKMYNAAQEMIAGLLNGLKNGAGSVIGFIRNLGTSIVDNFKKVLGIHSPSTVMAELGGNITLGLAEGITDNESAVQKAMDMLADDILAIFNKVIGNRVDFKLLNSNGVYKEWKKVSQMFTVGSEQYASALEKMEEARKSVNLEIISLQEDYNDTLDNTIDRLKRMYGLFDKVDLTRTANSSSILKNLDEQVAKMGEWQSAQDIISGLNISDGLKEELRNMGVESVAELGAIAGMTTSELEKLDELWLSKQSIATEEAGKQLEGYKNETLETISKLKDGVDGETVNVYESGGRLVSSLSDGIVGSLPTLEEAWSKIDDYVAKAVKGLGSGDGVGDGLDNENLEDEGLATTNIVEKTLNDITKTFEDNKGLILGILGGLAGSTIWKWFTGESAGQSLLGGLKNLFGKGGSGLSKVAESTGEIAKSSDVISKNIGSAGKSMGGVDKWFKIILEGAGAVIAIAGALAAVAGSIWVLDNALAGVSWEEFGSKLGMVAVAIVAMGALVGAIGTLIDKTKSEIGAIEGILAVVGLAWDITEVAKALGVMNREMDGMNWDNFGEKLGMMAATIGVMAAETGLIGAIMVLTGGLGALAVAGGVAAVLAYALDIAEMARALADVDRYIPNDMSGLKKKFEYIVEAIDVMSNSATLKIFSMAIKANTTLKSVEIAEAYGEIAKNLNTIQGIDLNHDAILEKVKLISKIVSDLTNPSVTQDSIWGTIKANIVNFINKESDASLASQITSCYRTIAENLNYIQSIELKYNEILSKVKLIGKVVEHLTNVDDEGGFWQAVARNWTSFQNSETVKHISDIVKYYKDIADSLNGLKEFKIDDAVESQLKTSIQKAMEIVGFLKQKLVGENPYDSTSLEGMLYNIAVTLGSGKLAKRAKDLSEITGKFKEVIDSISGIGTLDDSFVVGVAKTINSAYKLIYGEGNNKGLMSFVKKGNAQDVEWMLGMGASMAFKLRDFALALAGVNGDADYNTLASSLISALDTMFTNLNTNFNDRLSEFENLGANIGESLKNGILSKESVFYEAGAFAQGKIWQGVEDRFNDEYLQGQALGNKLRQGMYDVDYANAGWWAVQGFLNGASNRGYYSGGDGVYWAGWNIANTFLQGLKDRGQQGSPWKTTMQSGAWAVEGLVKGLEQNENKVIDEANLIADSVMEAFDFSDVSISPSVDDFKLSSGLDMEGASIRGGSGVIINQTNNNYSEYSVEAVNRDLTWMLSKV